LTILALAFILRRTNILISTTMIKIILRAVDRIEVFATNHPFMFQQILESYDELFWLVKAIIDSYEQWTNVMTAWI